MSFAPGATFMPMIACLFEGLLQNIFYLIEVGGLSAIPFGQSVAEETFLFSLSFTLQFGLLAVEPFEVGDHGGGFGLADIAGDHFIADAAFLNVVGGAAFSFFPSHAVYSFDLASGPPCCGDGNQGDRPTQGCRVRGWGGGGLRLKQSTAEVGQLHFL